MSELTPHDRELLARIDQLQTDANSKRQAMRFEPMRVTAVMISAAGAFMAAGGGIVLATVALMNHLAGH